MPVLHGEDLVAHLEGRVADAAGLDCLREDEAESRAAGGAVGAEPGSSGAGLDAGIRVVPAYASCGDVVSIATDAPYRAAASLTG